MAAVANFPLRSQLHAELIEEKGGHISMRHWLFNHFYLQISQMLGEAGNSSLITILSPVGNPVHATNLICKAVQNVILKYVQRGRTRIDQAQSLPWFQFPVSINLLRAPGEAAQAITGDIRGLDVRSKFIEAILTAISEMVGHDEVELVHHRCRYFLMKEEP